MTIQKVLEEYLETHGWTYFEEDESYTRWLIEGKNAHSLWIYLTTDNSLRFEEIRNGTIHYLRIVSYADPRLFEIIDEETKRSHQIPANAYTMHVEDYRHDIDS